MYREDRAGEAGLRHDREAMALALVEPRVRRDHGNCGVFANTAFQARDRGIGGKRDRQAASAKFTVQFKPASPELCGVADGHRANRVDGGERSNCDPVREHNGRAAEPAPEASDGCAKARAGTAQRKIHPRH